MKSVTGGGHFASALALILGSFLLAFAALAAHPQVAHAETWQQYLARQWQECEDTFAALDKETGLPAWDGSASTQPARGTGTPDDPWQVTSGAELNWVLHSTSAANMSLRLMNDIDMGHHAWSPVSMTASDEVVIDGAGHTVYNLYITGAGGASNAPGLAMFSYVNNPSFIMKDMTFRYAEVRSSGGNNQSVVIGYFYLGTLDNVGVVDSLVKGGSFVGGLAVGWQSSASDARRAVDNTGAKLENPTGVMVNNCRTVRVYTYGSSCIGNFIAPLWGGTVTNSYAVDGVTVSTAGHSGGFVSCPGYCYVENCFCNITMYGQSRTSVFAGVNHYSNGYKNCGASGVVEGETEVGGFLGDGTASGTAATPSQYENCYSTTMVGMQSTAQQMGGFVGIADGNLTFKNCYAAGEVGALKTENNAGSVGGFIGAANGAKFADCYYDMQTSSLKEYGAGAGTPVAAGGTGTITGKLTKELTGSDILASLPGFSSDVWVAKDGVYPQLKVLNNPTTYPEAERNTMTAYSMASVCTAMLYPSNGDYTDTNYDTVRSITYLFPFTNNVMANDSTFDISWEADDDKSTVAGMEEIPVITLKTDGSYAVASLAPGVGWTTVYVDYTPDPSKPEEHAVGTRRLRLVPTTTLSVATAAGVDHTAYVASEGARPLDQTKYLGLMTYDHRDGVNFSKGSAVNLADGTLATEAFPADSEDFENVELATVKGTVNVLVAKQDDDGEWHDVELTDDFKELLLNKRQARLDDLGHYRMIYHWYANGEGGAYLESTKYLDIVETFSVSYYRNDEGLEQPRSAPRAASAQGGVASRAMQLVSPGLQVSLAAARLAAASEPDPSSETSAVAAAAAQAAREASSAQPYYFDPGAYVPGDTVADDYYPGGANAAANPATEGYDFKGWSTEKEGGSVDFDASTALSGNTDVYGVWELKDRKVTFDMNGGTLNGSTDPIEQDDYKALDTVTAPNTTDAKPVREGYSFMGWSEDPNALTPSFDPDEQLWDDDKTYYAVWVPKPEEKVTVEVQNTTDPDRGTVQVGDVLENKVTPENTGDPDSIWRDVVITAPIPAGATLVEDSIVLKAPDGTEKHLPVGEVYDPETGILKVPVGDIPGGEKYELVFDTVVNPKALDEGADVTTRVDVAGADPDGAPRPKVEEEALVAGGDAVLPDDPEAAIAKAVTNETRGDAEDAVVGDVLTYTITLSNDLEGSLLRDAVITDVLPEGITLDEESIELRRADGTVEKLTAADVYDAGNRTLAVEAGDVAAKETAVLTFAARINDAAVDPNNPEAHNVGNVAVFEGSTPENDALDAVPSDIVFPTGWVKYVTPVPTVQKGVQNLDREEGFYQEDRLAYTIEVGNDMPATSWKNVVVADTLPAGLELVAGSVKLVAPDGSVEELPSDVYDAGTRTITALIEEVRGGEVWKLTYETTLGASPDDEPVVNRVAASGDGFLPGDTLDGDSSVSIPSPQPAPDAGDPVATAVKELRRRLPQTGDDIAALGVLLLSAVAAAVTVGAYRRSRRA